MKKIYLEPQVEVILTQSMTSVLLADSQQAEKVEEGSNTWTSKDEKAFGFDELEW